MAGNQLDHPGRAVTTQATAASSNGAPGSAERTARPNPTAVLAVVAVAQFVTANAHASSHAQALVNGYATAFAVAAAITLAAVAAVVALLPARTMPARAAAAAAGCHVGTRSALPVEVASQPASAR